MRFVTYSFQSKTRVGMLTDDDQIIDLREVNRRYLPGGAVSYLDSMQAFIEAGAKAVTTARKAARYVEGLDTKGTRRLAQAGILVKRNRARLLSPIPSPRKNVICLGVNYQEHIDEGVRARGVQLNTPEVPVFFTKPATSVIGDQGKVLAHPVTSRIDWEVELAVVIGRKGRNISAAKANDYIFGYTVCLDMTARDLQRRHLQWWKGKSLDTFCPLGPSLVHKSAMPDPKSVRLQCRVNGETMQDGNTRDMIFDIPTTIEHLSDGLTLEPGDIISTGTPSGVGFARTPPIFLNVGDKVEGEVEGIGVLEIKIAAAR
jgi:2-keto-4-pentenoate hydratase/2-oxohepta-3-ene-1,7-dioic acid hydratase in catechol pathway